MHNRRTHVNDSLTGPRCALFAALLAAALAAGCTPPPPPVTIELVNETPLDVTPGLYLSSEAADAGGLFLAENLVTDFSDRPFPELRPNESIILSYDCTRVGTVGVRAARLFNGFTFVSVISEDQFLLARGEDFACGAAVRIRFYVQDQAFRAEAALD